MVDSENDYDDDDDNDHKKKFCLVECRSELSKKSKQEASDTRVERRRAGPTEPHSLIPFKTSRWNFLIADQKSLIPNFWKPLRGN